MTMAANTNDFVVVGAQTSDATEHISKPALSFWQDAWRRLKLNKAAVVSMWFLILVTLFSVASLIFVPEQQANKFDSSNVGTYKNLAPKTGLPITGLNGEFIAPGATTPTDAYADQNVPEDKRFFLGTDSLGRSVAQRTIVGLRISLTIAIVATLIDLVIGVAYGMFSGWKGGAIDTFMQRVIEVMSSIPNLVVVTMLGLLLGNGMLSIILAIAFTGWLGMARQVRNMTLSLKERDYILAARSLGERPSKIMFKHLLPNMLGNILAQVMMTIPAAIMFEAVLSAINLGIQPPTASLGSLIADAQTKLQFFPWQLAVPGLTLVVLSLAFILLGDGLRDAFDPRASED
jgi:oligopeptide transport system permease protein